MTTLFLYVLGFVCLLIFGALLLDAYLAKKQIRQWWEWQQIADEDSDLSEGQNKPAKRPNLLLIGVLTALVLAVLSVAVFKKPVNAMSRAGAATLARTIQASDKNTETFKFENSLFNATEFYPANATFNTPADPNNLDLPQLMLGLDWMPDLDDDFLAPADVDSIFNYPDIELGCGVTPLTSTQEISESSAVESAYGLDGTFTPVSRLDQALHARYLFQ